MRSALLLIFVTTACGSGPSTPDAASEVDSGSTSSASDAGQTTTDAGSSSCTGTGACAPLSEIQCTAIEGGQGGCTRRLTPRCIDRGACTGQTQSACSAAGACRWSGTACVPEACSAQTSETACLNLRCAWATLYAGCEGTSFDCHTAASGLGTNGCESLQALGLSCAR